VADKITFVCPTCGDEVEMTEDEFKAQVADAGAPYCSDCDIEMEEKEGDEMCDVGMHTCAQISRVLDDGRTICPDCDDDEESR
jgi:peptide subunit release factor 1 (eRF1)